ncbi:Phage tail collar domain containing protein [uncultured Caudovirales phage]|uniref:Phage tail collar domain containing protein n=1 Tax=uncultured Caudovirales phage TaxID=2100421 RepID=A0A6J5LT79_9CAUD|nr:Phage tail collar domain containing protein [uncultured Caudovirales phage]CAB4171341.1 Phage tail collar domain containing protein [uncultured Caudovirales phage]CAB4183253.1 Phage tail collar domain containing protein [uncultured Caudovirales phage]CAB4200607.1 Phage tail collar domain containing protein [uncultured Caudovirales phage]CAB4213379.1 Phage tail collar domain containing protein [uncultured Caudovirales phage]
MAQIRKGTTYATGDQITATNLNAHVDSAILLPGAVTEQTVGTSINSTDRLLAADSALKTLTVAQVQSGLVRSDGTVAMTGELQLSSSTPSAALKAASKGYVDAAIIAAIAAATSTIVTQAAPTGCIMAWPGSTPPSGWIECNGQASTTPALVALVGANVPDLRGQFIRGWDHGSGLDPSRGLLSYQGAYAGNNTYTFGKDDGDGQTGPRGEVNSVTINSTDITVATDRSGFFTRTIDTNAGDTRPVNKALMFIIKT